MKHLNLLKMSIVVLLLVTSCTKEIKPILPVGPLPNEHQLAWQELEILWFYSF
jgi:hypothetical protein